MNPEGDKRGETSIFVERILPSEYILLISATRLRWAAVIPAEDPCSSARSPFRSFIRADSSLLETFSPAATACFIRIHCTVMDS